jgi:hypothetical protein
MESEQLHEFGRMQNDITSKLRGHAFIDDLSARHVFQYLILPSFSPPIAWDVFRRGRRGYADECILIRTSWRSDLDLDKLQTPVERLRHPYPLMPSIELHELQAPSAELERLARELTGLELPIGIPPSLVCIADGVGYEVAIEQPPHHISLVPRCRLSWCCDPPREWANLGEWVKSAEGIFEAAWAERGEAMPTPLRIKAIDDAAVRHQATQLFRAGHFGRVVGLLMEVRSRETLTQAESKMLELALKRTGAPPTNESGTM